VNEVWFVDRDGTIMKDVGYCNDPLKVELISYRAEGIIEALEKGIKIAIVSNQSGVARRKITPKQLASVTHEVAMQIAKSCSLLLLPDYTPPLWATWTCEQAARWPYPLLLPVKLTLSQTRKAELLFVYCPHHPDQMCACRKPQIGMAIMALCYWHGENWHETMQELSMGRVPEWLRDMRAQVFGDKESDREFAEALPFETGFWPPERFYEVACFASCAD